MPTFNETGHAKNVANFEIVISFVTSYGTLYNPSKANIKLPALNTLLTSAKAALTAVNNALPAYNNAVAARQAAFLPLKKLTTRIVNAIAATDTQVDVIDSVKTIARKLQGRRASSSTPIDNISADPSAPTPSISSSSQMSFDNIINNFEMLVQQLTAITLYAPNEVDLKTTALTAVLADLKAKNTAVINATTPLSNVRINRDKILYTPDTGLTAIALDVKQYVKSLFGATSPQYKQISKLRFVARANS